MTLQTTQAYTGGTMKKRQPCPGSPEAIALGCICPVLDNHHGRGRGKLEGVAVFIYNSNCKIHCGGAYFMMPIFSPDDGDNLPEDRD